MKKTIIAISLITAMNLNGAAAVVSDINSYTYYVKELSELKTMVSELKKQVETLGGIKTAVDEVKRAVADAVHATAEVPGMLDDALTELKSIDLNGPVNDLFSLKESSIGASTSDKGIFYDDVTALIDAAYTGQKYSFSENGSPQKVSGKLDKNTQNMLQKFIRELYLTDLLESKKKPKLKKSLASKKQIVKALLEDSLKTKDKLLLTRSPSTEALLSQILILQMMQYEEQLKFYTAYALVHKKSTGDVQELEENVKRVMTGKKADDRYKKLRQQIDSNSGGLDRLRF